MEFISYLQIAVFTAMVVMMFNMHLRIRDLESAIDEVDDAIDEMDADLEKDFARIENKITTR
jgi:hypothetical protein